MKMIVVAETKKMKYCSDQIRDYVLTAVSILEALAEGTLNFLEKLVYHQTQKYTKSISLFIKCLIYFTFTP